MSIKNDRWIRRMAEEEGMIEPFHASQVKDEEISNTTPLPAKVYAGEGIAQLLFFQGDEEPEVAYADRKGKYMDQQGVTLPKL